MTSSQPVDQHRNYPEMAAAKDRVEPAPRRVRGTVGDRVVFDTVRALYVWERPYYPRYFIPLPDVDGRLLVDESREQRLPLGTARRQGVRVGDEQRDGAARVYGSDAAHGLAGFVSFAWDALDSWFEEDEEIFVHPRNPYVRVDALRSHRHVRIELDGIVLADTRSPVLVFETGLPTRYYVDRTDVRLEHLERTQTETSCPYKGRTSDYWSVRFGDVVHDDLAWSYQFPTDALRPVAGMVSFFDELVDVVVDESRMARPVTHFVREPVLKGSGAR